jgi:DNA-binding transcriptional MerR regulator
MARPSNNSGLAIADLRRMLDQRRSDLKRLTKRRAMLQRDLAEVDREIEKISGKGGGGGGARRGGGTRARNETNLIETLDGVLRAKGQPMNIGDIVEGVLRTGYRSTSENFRGIVNQQLIKERKRFQKTGRGMYQLRDGKAARKGADTKKSVDTKKSADTKKKAAAAAA